MLRKTSVVLAIVLCIVISAAPAWSQKELTPIQGEQAVNSSSKHRYGFIAGSAGIPILVFWATSSASGSTPHCENDTDCTYPQVCIDNICVARGSNGGDGQGGGNDGTDRNDSKCTLNCPANTQCIKDGEVLWCEDGSGKLQGPYVERGDNGNVKIQGQYQDGQKEGTWNYYDGNGNRIREEQYVNNKIHGLYKTWYPDGSVMTKASFQNGQLHGPYKRFFQNGQVEMAGVYNNGTGCGFWTYYKEDGSVDHTSDNKPCP